MRRFNPEKELYKIQYGNKNKVIIGVVALLIILGISSSYALYQVRYSKRIIYTKVAPFSNHDIDLVVLVDGKSEDDFPENDGNHIYEKIDCGKTNVKAYWDYDKWALVLETSKKAKCTVYFKTGTSSSGEKLDTSGANPPELYDGLIPVKYGENGEVIVADKNATDWYNYDEKQWANAVLVDSTNYDKYVKNGKYQIDLEIPMNDILQMYVWIPRYKYQLFNVYNGIASQQMINIKFENGNQSTGDVSCTIDNKGVEICENAINGNWYTHPAFTFGNTELPGIWFSKFNASGSTAKITVKPELSALRSITLSSAFNIVRDIDKEYFNNYNLNKEEIDTHLTKNIEWGAMAYLTNSKYGRCDIFGTCDTVTRNSSSYLTGYAGPSDTWSAATGQLASTTGNIYGIYDISGSASDFVMGTVQPTSNSLPEFTDSPQEKYYDRYEADTRNYTYNRSHLGDAIREVMYKIDGTNAWGSCTWGCPPEAMFVTNSVHWFIRGGWGSSSNIFHFWYNGNTAETYISFHVVLTAQDGNE